MRVAMPQGWAMAVKQGPSGPQPLDPPDPFGDAEPRDAGSRFFAVNVAHGR
jgi:hypothetical protein